MDIIVLFSSRRKGLRVSLSARGIAATAALLLAVTAACFLSGARFGANRSEEAIMQVRNQAGSAWEQELRSQRAELERIRSDAEESLDAMASRLSLLQGHVMRIDALGSRLASMALLDDTEFDFDNPPGMGGPAPLRDGSVLEIPDFLEAMDHLEADLEDRMDKLAAMESMLLDRALREQTLPDGLLTRSGWISSVYGFRTDPITGRREFHSGIDVAGRPEAPITAVAAGIVTWSGARFGYGNMVEISHGNGYLTRYGHNRKNLVSVGEKVDKGEIIALMGSSGRSTGTHVHFEVVRYGEYQNPGRHMSLR